MRPGNLVANSAALRKALSALCARWEDAKTHWNDAVRQEFDENYIRPLVRQCQNAAERIDQLSQALGEIYRQCSPDRPTDG